MLVALRTPSGNPRGPQYLDQALAAIHQANWRRLPLGLDYGSIGLYCRFPDDMRSVVESQLYAQYPECRLERVDDDALDPPAGQVCWTASLDLVPDLFPIKRYAQFEDPLSRTTADPLAALLSSLVQDKGDGLHASIHMTLWPARATRCARARQCLRRLVSPFFRTHLWLASVYLPLALSPWPPLRWLSGVWFYVVAWGARKLHTDDESARLLRTSVDREHEHEQDLQGAAHKLGQFLFEARIELMVWGPNKTTQAAKRKLRDMAGAFGLFHSSRLPAFRLSRIHHRRTPSWWARWGRSFLLSTEEAASLWHPATETVRTPKLATVESRELEPPANLPAEANVAVLGRSAYRNRREKFGIRLDDRRRHVALLGKTGMGKSTLLLQLLTTDIQAGRGVALIDPHGDLADSVLAMIPKRRTNDVIWFDAGDREHPLPFNVLACADPHERPLRASGIVSAFKKLYGEFWGPRLEHILRNALLALLEQPGTSLLSLLQLLSDAKHRAGVVGKLSDPMVRAFWEHEFAGLPPKLQAEAIAPIQNKVGHFVSSPLLRNIVGQAHNSLDLRRVMDEEKVLIVNLSKGRTGEDASSLLGALLVTSLQLAAMSRADTPERERKDFFLYVDEFQNYATESFATILSEARKYRLNLTVANQYLGQLDENTLHALFGNVGTLVAFQVGAKDSPLIREQLGGEVTEQDLLALPRYRAYIRLLIDGMPSRPFSMQTLPPSRTGRDEGRAAAVRRESQRRFTRSVTDVEAEIRRMFTGK